MSSKGKCVYNNEWGRNPDYATWVRPFKADKLKALCAVCDRIIDVSNMGESALKSHAKGSKHVSNIAAANKEPEPSHKITQFFGPKLKSEKLESSTKCTETESMTIPPPPVQATASTSQTQRQSTISQYIGKNDVLKSEILWTLHTITSHLSYSSNEAITLLFRSMFPDSQVAANFTCGGKKTAYLCVFGIAEYFKKTLISEVKGPQTIMFDESLNKKMQQKQMDIHVRYWNENKVSTRYVGSKFIGHGTADNMLQHFQEGVLEAGLDIGNMIQVSMDGPNVNWKFYESLKTKLFQEYDTKLINIGSCGLHIVHNSFKSGVSASEWVVSDVLSSLYYLFKDAPARREDYQKITQCTVMPLKFVGHRWLENVCVCERAIAVWSNIEMYVKAVKEKKVNKPENKSYATIKEAVEDPLILAKLQFFKCIASHLKTFLEKYQTDKPMVAFLYQDLCDIIRSLMRRVVKGPVLANASSGDKLVTIDVSDKKNLVVYKDVDIGFSAEKAVKDAVKKGEKGGKTVSDKMVLEFREECKAFIVAVLKKLLQKCPVTYPMVRYMSALNPKEMQGNPQVCRKLFRQILTVLVSANRVKESDCDSILEQYSKFLDQIPSIGSITFSGFNVNKDRTDEFFSKHMSDTNYDKVLTVIKLLLVLSHGQASVERGFSVNKEVEVENLKDQSLVAQRLICDHVKSVGGVLKVKITDKLLQSASAARQKYEQHLIDERAKRKTQEEQRKRKATVDKIEELKEKKKKIKLDIETLLKSADELSEKAESTGKMTFVTQSNSFRRTAKDKRESLQEVDKKLAEQQEILKKQC